MAVTGSPLATTRQQDMTMPRWGALTPDRLLLPLVLIVTFVSHALNMFAYPLYLGDEGIYMEQAWAVLKGIGLSPYTYTYDHAPAGWLLIAAWLRLLPRGVAQWGMAENSGRVLMLLLALCSTALLYRLARRFTGSDAAAVVAALTFALSPLSLYYGRMVLLDTIMVFWLLLALELMTADGGLFALIGGGAAFGLAVLTKENAILFMPLLVYALYIASRERHFYRFGVSGWLYVCFGILSYYFLFAVLKGELLPPAPHGPQHVSLLGMVQQQLGRGVQHGSILNIPKARTYPGTPYGFWYYYFTAWAIKDPFILIAGTAATLYNMVLGVRRRDLRRIYLLSAGLMIVYVLYIVRGAQLIDFYIVPLLPFLALNIALAAHALVRPLPGLSAPLALIGGALALSVFFMNEHIAHDAFQLRQTFLQQDQVAYVRQHIPTNAVLMVDDDLWVNLHDGAGGLDPVYLYAYPYHKITGDPAVQRRLHWDWRRIQYIIASNQQYAVLTKEATPNDISLTAYRHSRVVMSWPRGVVPSANNVTVQVRQVDPTMPELPLPLKPTD
ncbi:MAG TPA: glycosyltransferase family 39 protein [Chloroflexota bacterium]|nr:glycosyltransferase family 39 protein [Chloroflexota bacterium]